MRYPIVFWDSGGTIFHSADRPEGFAGSPSPGDVRKNRAFRADSALEMFGHIPPPDLLRVIDELETDLRSRHRARYSLEVLAEGLYDQLGIVQRRGPLARRCAGGTTLSRLAVGRRCRSAICAASGRSPHGGDSRRLSIADGWNSGECFCEEAAYSKGL